MVQKQMKERMEATEKNVSAIQESMASLVKTMERLVLEMRENHKEVMYKIEAIE